LNGTKTAFYFLSPSWV